MVVASVGTVEAGGEELVEDIYYTRDPSIEVEVQPVDMEDWEGMLSWFADIEIAWKGWTEMGGNDEVTLDHCWERGPELSQVNEIGMSDAG